MNNSLSIPNLSIPSRSHTGVPRSPERTWAEKVGRNPSNDFSPVSRIASEKCPRSIVKQVKRAKEGRRSSLKTFALFLLLSTQPLLSQQASLLFATHCASCHGDNARGTAKAPGLEMNPRVAEQSADQLSGFLEHGNLAAGMPSFSELSTSDRTSLAN